MCIRDSSRYMDLQMDLEGAELCEVALGDVEEAEPLSLIHI